MKLRKNEYCPIHRSRSVAVVRKRTKNIGRFGVQRVEDPHHPTGYCELLSSSEMRKPLNRKVME